MDPYRNIARYYDCEHDDYRDDIDFYLSLVNRGPVLEVGCGTGRVLLPLAAAGYEVWGVDPSQAMLSRARSRLAGLHNVHIVEGALPHLGLEKTFPTILVALNTLWHLTNLEAQVEAVRVLRRHADAGAVLVLDLSNPHTMADKASRGELRLRFRKECDGRGVQCWAAASDAEADQRLSLSLTYEELAENGIVTSTWTTLEFRYLFAPEAELLLRLGSFLPRQIYGSYELDPYGPESPRILVLADAV